MGRIIALVCCAACAVLAAGSSRGEDHRRLDIRVIESLFEDRLNDDGFSYDLKHVKWHEGSFRDGDGREALVSFYDSAQCHAAGYSELWLLRCEDGWRLDEKIEDADTVEYEPLDIDGDGRLEVWIVAGGGNQGYFTYTGKLVSFGPASCSILYSNSGEDNTGAVVREGVLLRSHKMGFWDIDGDGVLEVLDLEEERTACPGAVGDETASERRQSIYRLIGGEFEETRVRALD